MIIRIVPLFAVIQHHGELPATNKQIITHFSLLVFGLNLANDFKNIYIYIIIT